MSVHYLVLAHKDPKIVARLVQALMEDDSARVYIHVDARTELEPFRAAIRQTVYFVPDGERQHVRWGDWSQVSATLLLLQASAQHMADTDYAVLLSGDSYPTQSARSISTYFSIDPSVEAYMNCVAMPSDGAGKPISRISRFHIAPGRGVGPYQIVARLVNMLHIPVDYRRRLGGRDPWAGSNWWVFSARVTRWVQHESIQARTLMKLAKHSQNPDEFYFQTLLMNSPFKSAIQPGVMYADFSNPRPPRPAEIAELQIDSLIATNLRLHSAYGRSVALFARKFGDAPQIISAVREKLWSLSIE